MDPSPRAGQLAGRLEAANREALEFAERCSDADWRKVCAGENWPLGVLVDHIADANELIEGAVRGYVEGREFPVTPAMVDAHNARHAVATADRPREETMARLRASVARMVETVTPLGDEQLDITFALPIAGGRPTSTAGVVEIVTAHVGEHLASARRALAG